MFHRGSGIDSGHGGVPLYIVKDEWVDSRDMNELNDDCQLMWRDSWWKTKGMRVGRQMRWKGQDIWKAQIYRKTNAAITIEEYMSTSLISGLYLWPQE